MFILKPDQTRCLSEMFERNELVFGRYDFRLLPQGAHLEVLIKNSKDHIALKREDVTQGARFAFTTDQPDYYSCCISLVPKDSLPGAAGSVEVTLDFLGGSDAKIVELAEEDLNKLEYNIDRIEMLTESMIKDFAHLKKRSKEMQDTNESTSKRMFYQALSSLIVLLALTIWQIVYMRAFFKVRKLIH